MKIAIKNKGERDSTFRQSKDASGSLSVCGEIGQSGIEGHRAVCIALDSGCRRKELPRFSVFLPLFRLLMEGKTGHEACQGKGDAPFGKRRCGRKCGHQITAFQALGQRKSADGLSANAGLVLSDQLDVLPVDSFLRCRAASCALVLLWQFTLLDPQRSQLFLNPSRYVPAFDHRDSRHTHFGAGVVRQSSMAIHVLGK